MNKKQKAELIINILIVALAAGLAVINFLNAQKIMGFIFVGVAAINSAALYLRIKTAKIRPQSDSSENKGE